MYIYIYIYIHILPCSASFAAGAIRPEGTEGVPRNGGLEVTTGLNVFYSQVFACPNPYVDRCSNPLPWDPLGSP